MSMTVWQVLFARPGTPPEALATLRGRRRAGAGGSGGTQRLAAAGCETWPDTSPPPPRRLLVRAEIARWTPIVAAMNLNPS